MPMLKLRCLTKLIFTSTTQNKENKVARLQHKGESSVKTTVWFFTKGLLSKQRLCATADFYIDLDNAILSRIAYKRSKRSMESISTPRTSSQHPEHNLNIASSKMPSNVPSKSLTNLNHASSTTPTAPTKSTFGDNLRRPSEPVTAPKSTSSAAPRRRPLPRTPPPSRGRAAASSTYARRLTGRSGPRRIRSGGRSNAPV